MQYNAANKKTDQEDPCFIYLLEGTDLENVESIKYLGVTITSDLRWNTHVSKVCTKANRTLGFLRRNLYSCPQEVKVAAYKGLVRPVLDYGRCSSPGRIRKRAKVRCQICDRLLQLCNWEYDWHSWTIKTRIPQEKEERQYIAI